MSEIWHNILQHPALALFCALCIGTWAAIEVYRLIFPARHRDHWSHGPEYGFRATGGKSDPRLLR